MGDVIQFSERSRPVGARPRERETGTVQTAEIMFFTGVRYQRANEAAPTLPNGDRPSSEGGKSKRKRG
jgi:hypothetical protein